MLGNFGDSEVDTPISSSQHLAGIPLLARHLAQAVEPPAVAHADLRRAQHQEGVGEARARRAGRLRGVATASWRERSSTAVRSSTSTAL